MSEPIRALLFDVDGTLYHQGPVRGLMAAEIAAHAVAGRLDGASRVIRSLKTFRTVREELRELACPSQSLEEFQFVLAGERVKESPAFVRSVVEDWMFRRPVKYLRYARRGSVVSLLRRLGRRGVALGVLSDYPAEEKLEGLGLTGLFSTIACTTDAEINALKPHPRGFLHACALLGLDAASVAYVGDRADVDAAGARAAGMRCYLVGSEGRRISSLSKEGSHGSGRFEDLEQISLSLA